MRQLFFSLAVLSLTIAKPVPEERSKIGTEPVHSLQDYGAVSDIITSDIGPVNQLNQAQTIGVAPDSQSQLLASDETNEAASSETDLEANEQCNAKDGLSKRGSGTPSNACSVTKTPQKVTLPVTGTQGGKQWRQNPNIDPSNPQAGERPIHLFSGTNWCPEKHPWILCSKDIPYENNPGAVPVMWRPQIFNCLFCKSLCFPV